MDFIEWREYHVGEDDIDVLKNYKEPDGSKSPRRLLIKTLIVLGGIAAVAVVLITVH
jgi:hypothetical protein